MKSITIYGPGLLGGSLALAIRERIPGAELCIWARRESAFDGIRARGIEAHLTTDAVAAARGASLIILATPIAAMPELARQITKADLPPECLITDVGSVKGSVVRALEPILGAKFVGSHPMAGSEKAGIDTARADLFVNAACLLTSTDKTWPDHLARLSRFWELLGCRVLLFSPDEHDRKVARISHLPHLMASVTALAALKDDREAIRCVANGFRDTTRVAAGDPDLWTGIVMDNRTALLGSMRQASETLRELLEIIEKADEEALRQFLAEAKSLRDLVPAAAI